MKGKFLKMAIGLVMVKTAGWWGSNISRNWLQSLRVGGSSHWGWNKGNKDM